VAYLTSNLLKINIRLYALLETCNFAVHFSVR